MDIWAPKISKAKEKYFYSLCFAYGLAENRAVVTRFEMNNPIEDAPEVFIDNPFSPLNPDSFWSRILDSEIVKTPNLALELVGLVKDLYRTFAINACSAGIIRNVGLHDEPYFKYFEYPDFLTPNSGLIQIKKYAEINHNSELHDIAVEISRKAKLVRDEIYNLLVVDFKYFE